MSALWRQSWAIARKELRAYFGSPMALIFVGAFLVVTLFSFFWAASFFVRNIADVRPLFQWMPILLIFLIATLTMRQWSEEQRSGTLDGSVTGETAISCDRAAIGSNVAWLFVRGRALRRERSGAARHVAQGGRLVECHCGREFGGRRLSQRRRTGR